MFTVNYSLRSMSQSGETSEEVSSDVQMSGVVHVVAQSQGVRGQKIHLVADLLSDKRVTQVRVNECVDL